MPRASSPGTDQASPSPVVDPAASVEVMITSTPCSRHSSSASTRPVGVGAQRVRRDGQHVGARRARAPQPGRGSTSCSRRRGGRGRRPRRPVAGRRAAAHRVRPGRRRPRSRWPGSSAGRRTRVRSAAPCRTGSAAGWPGSRGRRQRGRVRLARHAGRHGRRPQQLGIGLALAPARHERHARARRTRPAGRRTRPPTGGRRRADGRPRASTPSSDGSAVDPVGVEPADLAEVVGEVLATPSGSPAARCRRWSRRGSWGGLRSEHGSHNAPGGPRRSQRAVLAQKPDVGLVPQAAAPPLPCELLADPDEPSGVPRPPDGPRRRTPRPGRAPRPAGPVALRRRHRRRPRRTRRRCPTAGRRRPGRSAWAVATSGARCPSTSSAWRSRDRGRLLRSRDVEADGVGPSPSQGDRGVRGSDVEDDVAEEPDPDRRSRRCGTRSPARTATSPRRPDRCPDRPSSTAISAPSTSGSLTSGAHRQPRRPLGHPP